jgi:hypothetical protein
MRSLVSEVEDDSDLLFNQYKLGSSDPAYTAGTYHRRDVVIFNGGVYECIVDSTTNDPTDQISWRRISVSFIGSDERIGFRSEKLVLEYALNKWFGTVFRQPPSTSDIFLQNNTVTTPVFIVGEVEDESSDIYTDSSSEFIIDGYDFTNQYNFAIHIPTAVYDALGSAKESIVRNFADKYVIAGILYTIIPY